MQSTKLEKTIFIISIIAFLYCITPRFITISNSAVLEDVFEIISLPMMATFAVIPVISLVLWLKQRCSLRSLHGYSFLISLITLFFLVNTIRDIEC